MIERIEDAFGNVTYKTDGKHHRVNGPCVTATNGRWWWMLHDEYHRYYGPHSWLNGWMIHGGLIKCD